MPLQNAPYTRAFSTTMSTTILRATETTSSTLGLGAQPTDITSPISKALPYISTAFLVLKYLFGLIVWLFGTLQHLSPLPIVLYVLGPVIAFLDIAATVFIRAPYNGVVYLLDAIYPLYVFCGVACITGGLLGLVGRVLCRVVINMAQRGEEKTDRFPPVKRKLKPIDKKAKGKERERSPAEPHKLER